MLYGAETARLEHIERTQGFPEAMEFAKRTLKIYRSAVLRSSKRGAEKPHFASTPDFRRKFIESYVGFKAYIAINNSPMKYFATLRNEQLTFDWLEENAGTSWYIESETNEYVNIGFMFETHREAALVELEHP